MNKEDSMLSLIENSQEELVANDKLLRHEDYIAYDRELVQIVRRRLNGIQDLRNAGLVQNIGSIGTTISRYEKVSDLVEATVSMDFKTDIMKDRLTFEEAGIPVPIISQRWELDARQVAAYRQGGASLPMEQMRAATFTVVEKLEDMLFKGVPDLNVDGAKLYGYTNHPDRIVVSFTEAWTSASNAKIMQDVTSMLKEAYAKNINGPFTMYVANNLWATLQADYSDAKGTRTFIERIEAYSDISVVKPSTSLADNFIVMVQMDSNTIELAVARDVSNLVWSSTYPFTNEYMVYAVMAPKIKSDKNGTCGLIYAGPNAR